MSKKQITDLYGRTIGYYEVEDPRPDYDYVPSEDPGIPMRCQLKGRTPHIIWLISTSILCAFLVYLIYNSEGTNSWMLYAIALSGQIITYLISSKLWWLVRLASIFWIGTLSIALFIMLFGFSGVTWDYTTDVSSISVILVSFLIPYVLDEYLVWAYDVVTHRVV